MNYPELLPLVVGFILGVMVLGSWALKRENDDPRH